MYANAHPTSPLSVTWPLMCVGLPHPFPAGVLCRCAPVSVLCFLVDGAASMSQQSTIEWTDATWNPVRGCTKITPGCKHCYAETFAERFRGVKGHAYEQGFDLRLVPEKL